MARYVLICLNPQVPAIELQAEKPSRLGPGLIEAPFTRVEAQADYQKGKVRLKNLGVTKCLINFQQVLRRGEEALVNTEDLVDLTFGTYVYQIKAWTGPLPLTPAQQRKNSLGTEQPLLHNTKGVQKFQNNINEPISPQSSGTVSTVDNNPPTEPIPEHDENAFSNTENVDQSVLDRMVDSADAAMIREDASRVLLTSDATPDVTTTAGGETEGKKITDEDWTFVNGILGRLPILAYEKEYVLKSRAKIAGFDLDSTLIKPTPLDNNERFWEFMYPNTVSRLKEFFSKNPDHKFIIVTNKAKAGYKYSKQIIEEVVLELGLPVIVFAAKEGTEFLKPAPFVWDVYSQLYNEGVEPNWSGSFFCGDCAGRPRDISKGDRLFALNAGTNFKTPEQFFLDSVEEPFALPSFCPSVYMRSEAVTRNNEHIRYSNKVEVIVMCGSVASGKSRFVETTLEPKGYLVIKACPQMATHKARLDAIAQALIKKTPVVVDRRNIDGEERAGYVRLATSHKVPIRCFVMDVSEPHVRHNLRFHEIRNARLFNNGEVELNIRRHQALFEKPTQSEGFSEIVPVNFIPKTFLKDASDLKLYSKFLIQR